MQAPISWQAEIGYEIGSAASVPVISTTHQPLVPFAARVSAPNSITLDTSGNILYLTYHRRPEVWAVTATGGTRTLLKNMTVPAGADPTFVDDHYVAMDNINSAMYILTGGRFVTNQYVRHCDTYSPSSPCQGNTAFELIALEVASSKRLAVLKFYTHAQSIAAHPYHPRPPTSRPLSPRGGAHNPQEPNGQDAKSLTVFEGNAYWSEWFPQDPGGGAVVKRVDGSASTKVGVPYFNGRNNAQLDEKLSGIALTPAFMYAAMRDTEEFNAKATLWRVPVEGGTPVGQVFETNWDVKTTLHYMGSDCSFPTPAPSTDPPSGQLAAGSIFGIMILVIAFVVVIALVVACFLCGSGRVLAALHLRSADKDAGSSKHSHKKKKKKAKGDGSGSSHSLYRDHSVDADTFWVHSLSGSSSSGSTSQQSSLSLSY